jgi:hypothetical protein
MTKRNKYHAGQVFAIPLEGFYAVGIIVRENKGTLLGYFLKQQFKDLPVIESIDWSKADYILKKQFSSLGLDKGAWTIIGVAPGFDSASWELPIFKRMDALDGQYYKVFYDERLKETGIHVMDADDNPDKYPDDGLAGYGFIEKRLTRLLEC